MRGLIVGALLSAAPAIALASTVRWRRCTGTFHVTFKGPRKTFNNAVVVGR